MINLLPSETRVDLLYARRNSVLRRWLINLTIALAITTIIVAGGVFYLSQTTKNLLSKTATARDQLKAQKIDETQTEVEQLSSNVKLTTQVLSREILFSKLLVQLGTALPANTALSQLQIDKLQGGITITALAKDFESGSQIQLNLEDPKNQIFQKADLENISCSDEAGKIYPCTVQLRALFADDNPFLFISDGKKGTTQ